MFGACDRHVRTIQRKYVLPFPQGKIQAAVFKEKSNALLPGLYARHEISAQRLRLIAKIFAAIKRTRSAYSSTRREEEA